MLKEKQILEPLKRRGIDLNITRNKVTFQDVELPQLKLRGQVVWRGLITKSIQAEWGEYFDTEGEWQTYTTQDIHYSDAYYFILHPESADKLTNTIYDIMINKLKVRYTSSVWDCDDYTDMAQALAKYFAYRSGASQGLGIGKIGIHWGRSGHSMCFLPVMYDTIDCFLYEPQLTFIKTAEEYIEYKNTTEDEFKIHFLDM